MDTSINYLERLKKEGKIGAKQSKRLKKLKVEAAKASSSGNDYRSRAVAELKQSPLTKIKNKFTGFFVESEDDYVTRRIRQMKEKDEFKKAYHEAKIVYQRKKAKSKAKKEVMGGGFLEALAGIGGNAAENMGYTTKSRVNTKKTKKKSKKRWRGGSPGIDSISFDNLV